MQVFRYPFDRSVLGRNAYANLYQFQAQLQYLKKLQSVRSRSSSSRSLTHI